MNLGSILLIEDERINALAFKKGLANIKATNELIIQETAENGLQYLRNENNRPDIIMLDLNLPKMNGIDFLKVIKSDSSLKRIPVIVLTTSVNPQDKIDCFDLQVAGYFIKPIDYFELIKSLYNYWTKSEFTTSDKKN
jgi:CheY-like chemotaxis protein